MKRQLIKRQLLAAALLSALCAHAQKIDINNTANWSEDRLTETGYKAWPIGTVSNASITVDGVTVKIAVSGKTSSRTLKGNWWKDGIQKYSKLVDDGVAVYGLVDGNTPQIQAGEVAIEVTLSGLSAGAHTLLAYHNNTDGYDAPTIGVKVNGEQQLTGIAQTNRSQKASEAGRSLVSFLVEEGQRVSIVYFTEPDETVDYTQGYRTTTLFINGLEVDGSLSTATDPQPANLERHANADNNQVTLSWRPAEGAVSHRVVVADSKEKLNTASAAYQGTDTFCIVSQTFSPLQQYYWRVDEVMADGSASAGEVWTFQPRRLAFPDAEGYGRFAIGGRGGTVYHVTSLDDDVSNPQPGTFRYGISKVSGPRTIVFDVSGVIYLKGRLTCSEPYVTIAGQTAPGRGIMFRGAPFGMASDGITRFIRMRRGHILDDADANRGLDGLGMAGNDNAIMDHCSISWTIDEGFSSRGAKNVTLQRTLISEALNVAGHPNYGAGTAHGYAATIGGGENGGLGSSYHHNLLAHNEGRNWSMSGGLDGAGVYDGHHDMFNNVVYNWGGRATDGGTHEGQFVGNYYKMGPATTQKLLLKAELEGPHPGTQSYYVSGNVRENLDGSKTADKLNDTYNVVVKAQHSQQWDVFVDKPFFESFATVETAEAAFKNVLSDVGCNQPALDNHDERMIRETLLGTTSTKGSKSGKKGLIDHEDDAEGFGGLNIAEERRPDTFDTDRDGIPDWFEEAVGTDKATPNNNADRDNDGYTDLEEYLNWLAEPHFDTDADGRATVDLKPYFAGYKNISATLPPEKNDGTSGTVSADGVLSVWCGIPKIMTVAVTVEENGITMTRSFNFRRPDGATSLRLPSSPVPLPLYTYNLLGQRLSQPQRGINISNGKKMIYTP